MVLLKNYLFIHIKYDLYHKYSYHFNEKTILFEIFFTYYINSYEFQKPFQVIKAIFDLKGAKIISSRALITDGFVDF